MDTAMKPQTSGVATEMPGNAPPPPTTTTPAPLAHGAPYVDHVPRLLRWVQAFVAGLTIALSIGASVGFQNVRSRYDLVGGGGYVTALVIAILVAIYTAIILCLRPVPARLIAEYVAIPLWLLAAIFLAAESAIVMNTSCDYSYECIYIYGAGPNAGCVATALGALEVALFCYTAYRGRQMKRAGVVREMEMGGSHV